MTEPYEEEQTGNGEVESFQPHLPATTADLHRKSPRRYSIRQEVEDIWERVYNGNAQFRRYLDGASNDEAYTGKLRFDNVLAANMILEASDTDSQLRIPMKMVPDPTNPGKKINVGGPGLGKIWEVLHEVLKVWEISRTQQQETRQDALEA